tara:strand:+ start:168 stop:392 length:225 start_codon:yes stop_codon:yes gene_type:complete
MSTEKINGMWAVAYDSDELIVIKLDSVVNECRRAFTRPKPRPLTLPILSVWETEEEANEDIERLRGFEELLDAK